MLLEKGDPESCPGVHESGKAIAGEPPPRPDLRILKSREYLTKLKSWRAFLVAQTVKNPAAMWETWV